MAPGYGPPPYGYPGHGYAPTRTSGYAIAALVLGIVWVFWIGSVLAVIFGHIALNETNREPQVQGKGMAIAGLVLGYGALALLALGLVGSS
jgi:hypothetical protein